MTALSWQLPYLTADLPGIGGVIRAEMTDFIVEEVPAYEPSGEGEHTFFAVEKTGQPTFRLIQQLAGRLGISERDIGYAGLKDARAVARQTLSVPNVPPETLLALELDQARVLWAERHIHKLRIGHLRGNRFTLRIRETVPDAAERVAAILAVLTERGVPNGYGPQRFGRRGDNAAVGLALLRNDRAALRELGVRQIPYRLRRLYLSALQSALFNQLLAARIAGGTMDRMLLGDVAKKQETGGIFNVEDLEAEQPRAQAWEISPTGPIYGYKMRAAQADAAALEADILAQAGLMLEDFRPAKLKGSRRPLRYRLDALEWQLEEPHTLVIAFFAPKGSFATLLLRELMKTDQVLEEDDDPDA